MGCWMNVYASNLDNSENMKKKLPVGEKKKTTNIMEDQV